MRCLAGAALLAFASQTYAARLSAPLSPGQSACLDSAIDRVDATDGGRVGEVPAEGAAAACSVRIKDVSEGQVVISNTDVIYGGQAVRAETADPNPNVLRHIGPNRGIAFTLEFGREVDSVCFTRPALKAATDSGITFPAWLAVALDRSGDYPVATTMGEREPDSISPGAPMGRPFGSHTDVPSRRFRVVRPAAEPRRIKSVRFGSDALNFAAFNGVVLDDFELDCPPLE